MLLLANLPKQRSKAAKQTGATKAKGQTHDALRTHFCARLPAHFQASFCVFSVLNLSFDACSAALRRDSNMTLGDEQPTGHKNAETCIQIIVKCPPRVLKSSGAAGSDKSFEDGYSVVFDVAASTVADFKEFLRETLPFSPPPKDQLIFCRGRPLQNHEKMLFLLEEPLDKRILYLALKFHFPPGSNVATRTARDGETLRRKATDGPFLLSPTDSADASQTPKNPLTPSESVENLNAVNLPTASPSATETQSQSSTTFADFKDVCVESQAKDTESSQTKDAVSSMAFPLVGFLTKSGEVIFVNDDAAAQFKNHPALSGAKYKNSFSSTLNSAAASLTMKEKFFLRKNQIVSFMRTIMQRLHITPNAILFLAKIIILTSVIGKSFDWTKRIFMLVGMLFAYLYQRGLLTIPNAVRQRFALNPNQPQQQPVGNRFLGAVKELFNFIVPLFSSLIPTDAAIEPNEADAAAPPIAAEAQ